MPESDGVFARFRPVASSASEVREVLFELVRPAGRPRDIPMGTSRRPVAAQPEDKDFAQAAVWRIRFPKDVDLTTDPLLRFNYVGDVARVSLNGELLTDDFYNGNPLEIGLRRYAPEIPTGELLLQVLPLRKDAPIYLSPEAQPNYGTRESVAELQGVELIPRPTIQFASP
jgi:hypothetical protein